MTEFPQFVFPFLSVRFFSLTDNLDEKGDFLRFVIATHGRSGIWSESNRKSVRLAICARANLMSIDLLASLVAFQADQLRAWFFRLH